MFGTKLSDILKGGAGGGALVIVLQKAWEIGKGIIISSIGEGAESVGKKIVKKVVDAKGWEDEHYFALDLAEVNFGNDNKKKKDIIEKGMLIAEEYDRQNGTKSARNFRLIVSLKDKVDTPSLPRPGVNILKYVGDKCENEKEVFLLIQAVGAMHDPTFTLEKFIHVGRTVILPFLQTKGINFVNSIDRNLSKAEAAVQKCNEGFKKRSFLKKLLMN